MSFLVTNRREFGPNPHQIPWRFHVIYPGFLFLPMLEHDMDFGWVQVMEFPWHLPRKWWDFHWILYHFRNKPNCRQKDLRKYKVSHFLQGQFVFMREKNAKTYSCSLYQDVSFDSRTHRRRWCCRVFWILAHTGCSLPVDMPPHKPSSHLPLSVFLYSKFLKWLLLRGPRKWTGSQGGPKQQGLSGTSSLG